MDLRLTVCDGGVYVRSRGGEGAGSMLGGSGVRGGAGRGGRRAPAAATPGGGGEPRAARLDVARPHSVPPPVPRALCPTAAQRRARSAAPRTATPAAPRLRPLFLWARQLDGTVQEVRCEDYDSRNRIRIARTPLGWRVIPRTEIYNSIRLPPPPAPVPRRRTARERRRRKRRGGSRRRVRSPRLEQQWLAPDLESHIPSHTIAVPRALPPVATPLDNLLAVAELEFNQQRSEDCLEATSPTHPSYEFIPPEETPQDAMSFEIGQAKPTEEMFFERKVPSERADEFPGDMSEHKDLFETISEAHYLPELDGPHDEALLESLVEKGCEDNQILGQALDKLAHLVHSAPDYPGEDEDMLLGNAPVSDIIERLEQSLESPSRSSMTAAQGLLHLHHIGDHLQHPEQQQMDTYMSDAVFATEECGLQSLDAPEVQNNNDVKDMEFSHNDDEKRLDNDVGMTDIMYTEQVPDSNETFLDKQFEEPPAPSLPDHSEVMLPVAEEPEPEPEPEEQISECVLQSEKSDSESKNHDNQKRS
ncbi:unnamed protein product [Leptosia nina]|uniref:Uncharacterized protein n=1 Tax=Leptosia nina TaxID=320188 RepID=A0AAV1K0E5_9NEOP